jgi:flagellar basal-body rod protein FlgB
MNALNRLTQTLDFQAQALTLRSERQRVLASNIANADTPGYVARDMDFTKALREATAHLPTPAGQPSLQGGGMLGTPGSPAGLRMAAVSTQSGHLALPAAQHTSTLSYALASQNAVDRNTVDMDRERATFADNSVRYEASLRFINGSVNTLRDAMKPFNQ